MREIGSDFEPGAYDGERIQGGRRYLRISDSAFEDNGGGGSPPPPEDAIPDWLASLLWWPVTFLGFLLRLV